ncbi:MAG: hypothetical protein IJ411_00330 [Oscillospiraceae bacterium]|nr:hypothetical protein [Oscillospiraceae bacterium]
MRMLCILLVLALLTGCTQSPKETAPPQETAPPEETVVEVETVVEEEMEEREQPLQGVWDEELTALMETINAEHKAVEKPPVNTKLYDQYFPEREKLPAPEQPDTELMVEVLTQEQAIYDVSYLCFYLSDNYALYDYFGGNEAFGAARDVMIEKIKTQEQWTPEELQKLILEQLSFVQDHHFGVKGSPIIEKYPIFYREVEFRKGDKGYETPEGKVVASVSGQEDLDTLFKRSLNPEGDVVYYPVLFESVCALNGSEMPGELTVTYMDGTEQMLQPEEYRSDYINGENQDKVVIEEEDGISKLTFKNFMNSSIATAGTKLKDAPVLLIDIRDNGGGHSNYGWNFWKNYSGQTVTNNHLIFFQPSDEESMSDPYGVGTLLLDGRRIMNTKEDVFAESDSLTVVLSAKSAYSAAEDFVDTAHNVENTLIIGENTAGCLMAGNVFYQTLRYSNLMLMYSECAIAWPDGHFSEGYGLEPDLWCPAWYAEEAAVNFIQKHIQ